MATHLKAVHAAEDASLQFVKCPVCDKLFEDEKQLNRHNLLLHICLCQFCNQRFGSHAELQQHKTLAHADGLMVCNVDGCTKSFKSPSALVAHKKAVCVCVCPAACVRVSFVCCVLVLVDAQCAAAFASRRNTKARSFPARCAAAT